MIWECQATFMNSFTGSGHDHQQVLNRVVSRTSLRSNMLWQLVMVAQLMLTMWPCDIYGVGAETFAFNGFKGDEVFFVLDSPWTYYPNTSCFYFNPDVSNWNTNYPGRMLRKGPVKMKDPGSTTVKSFSTTFIYQLQIHYTGSTGPGMALIFVPDNVTVGGPQDYMGLITMETPATPKNYKSDNHTFGVELDTHQNPEFDDINSNHIGINIASMNSTKAFEVVYNLASGSSDIYQQVWIDYFEADSRMDIYYAYYGQGKPATPQGSQSGLDLSISKEDMYIGFSTSQGIESDNAPYIYAWSFSNDIGTLAPEIVIGPDAPPPAPPPPPGLLSPPPPPGPRPTLPPTGPPEVPPSPAPSPPAPAPPQPVPAPHVPPTPSPSSQTPAPLSPVPSTSRSPPPPPSPSTAGPLPPGPHGTEPATPRMESRRKNGTSLAGILGILASVSFVGLCTVLLCWSKAFKRPLRIFISHTGGPDGSGKNFPTWLYQKMKNHIWSRIKFRVKVFLDVENCPVGLSFAQEIFKELARFDVGVVVVTEDFFARRWPMTELIAFVEAQMKDQRIRVLPLFYEISPDGVRSHLEAKQWEKCWEEFSKGNHPLETKKCREAVNWLCKQRGISYRSQSRDYDADYIDTILKKVDEILCEERSFAADLRWAMNGLCPRWKRIHREPDPEK